ncbi:sensor histidine kinase [Microbacterium oleivorans]|uniref:sensor histidine kinase n=1 Tax=Microbacterium oleivorans TaxID=273677 RepID=UPI00139061B0|nr:GAF domain-containing protein [Microbacterium oleivorans]
MIAGEIELPTVLRRVIEASVELVDAEYGALGVIGADRSTLEQFIHVGVTDETAERIGHLPHGHGLLGAVVEDPRPIRLEHLAYDGRAVGFPPHHPPMDSFLGAPVRIRGEVFGNLYLANSRNGAFSAEDERLVEALASTAGLIIANARLFEEARLRAKWMSATADVSGRILGASPEGILELVIASVQELTSGGRTAITAFDEATGRRRVRVGPPFDDDAGEGAAPADSPFAAGVIDDGRGRIRARTDACGDDAVLVTRRGETGPAIGVPLRNRERAWGALTVARSPDGQEFTPLELTVLGDFASQVGIALELAHATRRRQRALVSDERARIARDLHDHVIQQLFGAGLSLQSALAEPETIRPERGQEIIAQIDDAIRQIRTVIFAISAHGGTSVRHRLIDVVVELSVGRAHPPTLRFTGPLDIAIKDDLADDVVATARELLSNSVRHARADAIRLDVAVEAAEVTVTVIDDGIGISGRRRSGLDNIARRAENRKGAFSLDTGAEGTRARWAIPLPEALPEAIR